MTFNETVFKQRFGEEVHKLDALFTAVSCCGYQRHADLPACIENIAEVPLSDTGYSAAQINEAVEESNRIKKTNSKSVFIGSANRFVRKIIKFGNEKAIVLSNKDSEHAFDTNLFKQHFLESVYHIKSLFDGIHCCNFRRAKKRDFFSNTVEYLASLTPSSKEHGYSEETLYSAIEQNNPCDDKSHHYWNPTMIRNIIQYAINDAYERTIYHLPFANEKL